MSQPDDHDLPTKVVLKLIRNKVWGKKHHQIQTVSNWFPSDQQGDVKDAIDEMIVDPGAPLQQKGRGTIQLVSKQRAIEFIKESGGELPFGMG